MGFQDPNLLNSYFLLIFRGFIWPPIHYQAAWFAASELQEHPKILLARKDNAKFMFEAMGKVWGKRIRQEYDFPNKKT